MRHGAAVADPDVAWLEQHHVPGELLAAARSPVAEQPLGQDLQQPLQGLALESLQAEFVVAGIEQPAEGMAGVPDARRVIHVQVEPHGLEVGGALVDIEVQVLHPRLGVAPDDVAGGHLVMAQELAQQGAHTGVEGPDLGLELAEQAAVPAEQLAAEVLFHRVALQRLGPLQRMRGELLEEPGGRECHRPDERPVVVDRCPAQQDAFLSDIVLHQPSPQILRTAVGGGAPDRAHVVLDEIVLDRRVEVELGHSARRVETRTVGRRRLQGQPRRTPAPSVFIRLRFCFGAPAAPEVRAARSSPCPLRSCPKRRP